MANKFVNMDGLMEVTFYEALEYFSQGCLIESHLHDQDGIILEWNKYSLFDDTELEGAIPFREIIYGSWYVDKESLMFFHGDSIQFESDF